MCRQRGPGCLTLPLSNGGKFYGLKCSPKGQILNFYSALPSSIETKRSTQSGKAGVNKSLNLCLHQFCAIVYLISPRLLAPECLRMPHLQNTPTKNNEKFVLTSYCLSESKIQ